MFAEQSTAAPVRGEELRKDALIDQWYSMFEQQPEKVQHLLTFFPQYEWFEKFVDVSEFSEIARLSQKVSAQFLIQMEQPDLHAREPHLAPHEVLCEWLEGCYQSILIMNAIRPGSAIYRITAALLDNQCVASPKTLDQWSPTRIGVDQQINFVGASTLRIRKDTEGFHIGIASGRRNSLKMR